MVAAASPRQTASGAKWIEEVLAHPVLRGTDPARVRPVVARLHPVRVGKGGLVAGPVASVRSLYLVIEGTVHAFVLTADGRRLLLEMIGPGGFDGLLFAASAEGHFAEAATTACLLPITNGHLAELIASDPHVARNLLDLTLERLARREAQMAVLTQGEGLRRVAQQLAAIARYAGRVEGDWSLLEPRPTHQTLAEMIGLRRETVTIQLGVLRRLDAVRVEASGLRLHIARLIAVAEGSTGGRPLPQPSRG